MAVDSEGAVASVACVGPLVRCGRLRAGSLTRFAFLCELFFECRAPSPSSVKGVGDEERGDGWDSWPDGPAWDEDELLPISFGLGVKTVFFARR